MAQMVQDNVHDAIAKADERFMALYRQGNAAGIAGLYTDDAVVMPPNADFVRGKPAIEGLFKAFMDMGIKALVFDILEVGQSGDFALEMSTFKLIGPEEKELDHGKYLVVWKLEGGQWKLFRDIFNSSVPA